MVAERLQEVGLSVPGIGEHLVVISLRVVGTTGAFLRVLAGIEDAVVALHIAGRDGGLQHQFLDRRELQEEVTHGIIGTCVILGVITV